MIERLFAAVLLALALAAFVHFARGGEVGFPPPHWPSGRARYFTRAASRIAVLFGATSILLLAVAGRIDALRAMPRAFAPLRQVTGAVPLAGETAMLLAAAVLGGAAIGAIGARLLRRRLQVGRIGAVLPRARSELGWGVLLSLVAGVSEELFFRLLVPLLATAVTGSPLIGFAAATLLFGAAHRYQGWTGVVATMLVGALLAYAYLLTASLWVAIALHVFIDLNALVLRPVLSGQVRLRR
ncbi:CPBP family intramembrane metalloprotease [Sphingomonas sp. RHCKR47]|uniref:CPBP family intramembrane glutamic endopeptidase n=1 Tax=Sphingomonas citricola TaxID=2862498 RepID=UPI001C685BA4|nr:CPBP family intramembrane glutamic endopeptidase [Sphingomonas citricola]MBW6524907.1 CPBP family intramembrane metalloprotease [Sphingomonas citricola]